MKKITLVLVCCILLFTIPLVSNAYTDTEISKAGVTIKKEQHFLNTGTDNEHGTFPSKIPNKRLPQTGDSETGWFCLLGLGLIVLSKEIYFKEVKKKK
ncbi:LPXTG cell wall anchor domain-containing protein [Listeria monocytogenes]|nr:LPXTG cell wall anchor domain-containing protein [Listeria monocytogenes]